MRLAVFGLSVSSSWGNGHASLWRGLIAALAAAGHRVTFFERDVPYYAEHRDLRSFGDEAELVLFEDWDQVRGRARAVLAESDVGVVTSFCPDAVAATALIREAGAAACFYDLDTPVTLARLDEGSVAYLGSDGLAPYDLVLSYTGGGALAGLRDRLGARRVEPLYGWADPSVYKPSEGAPQYRADLSYLGTYAADRQDALQALFLEPARMRPAARFVIGGAQYPADFPWSDNIHFVQHLPPGEHPAFFSSSRLTLNVTRGAMARMGHCPSGRLFEAACCATPIATDWWEGLDEFFGDDELVVCRGAQDMLAAMDLSDVTLAAMAGRARARVLGAHTAAHRAARMVALLETIGPGTGRLGS